MYVASCRERDTCDIVQHSLFSLVTYYVMKIKLYYTYNGNRANFHFFFKSFDRLPFGYYSGKLTFIDNVDKDVIASRLLYSSLVSSSMDSKQIFDIGFRLHNNIQERKGIYSTGLSPVSCVSTCVYVYMCASDRLARRIKFLSLSLSPPREAIDKDFASYIYIYSRASTMPLV